MVKDHSISEKGNPLPPLRERRFPIAARVTFNAPPHRQDSTYTAAFVNQWWRTGWNEKKKIIMNYNRKYKIKHVKVGLGYDIGLQYNYKLRGMAAQFY